MHSKACWYVDEEIRKRYVDEELPLPNRWSYTLIPKKRRNDNSQMVEKVEKEDNKKNVPLITQFTKKITQEEMKKQLIVKPNCTQSRSTVKPPKRARLISVKRGEELPRMSRENLLKDLVNVEDDKGSIENNDNDVIILGSKSNENDDQKGKKGDRLVVAGATESGEKRNAFSLFVPERFRAHRDRLARTSLAFQGSIRVRACIFRLTGEESTEG